MQIVRSAKSVVNVPVSRTIGVAASQTINVGDLLQINATSKLLEAAAPASTTIAGIAEASITTSASPALSDQISVTLIKGEVIRAAVSQAGTKKTFATTDKYLVAYDLLNKTTIAPDDITGGMCYVQGYDNTLNTVDFIVADANLAYLG